MNKHRAGDPVYDALAQWADQVGREVDQELNDPRFPKHHHGRPIGYNSGCRGPLCRKSQRDRIRNNYPAKKRRGPDNPMLEQYLEIKLIQLREDLRKSKENKAS